MEARGLSPTRGLEEKLRAEDVRPREETGIDHSEAVVGLRREVDDDVDLVLAQHVLDDIEVGNVRLDERNALLGAVEIGPVPRVCQEVERDERVAGMPLEPVVHEVRADEAGRAGDEDPHGVSLVVLVALAPSVALPAGPDGSADLFPLALKRL
jgi:hypothetical protein